MTIEQLAPLKDLDGFVWNDNEQAVLTGQALLLYMKLDELFSGWAQKWNAAPWKMPTFIAA